ncbi:AMP-binding protein [Simiduia sp. 21SJ11W-1]|uniref:AMP-binding protein n=1 Tax=Simiduia sp. 21SJ11W-1 TaxID=2909669 RepID=UPI0020A0CA1B|nr:AMP-binding protein [Simiduia sp. 21SJ11W-1]UTA49250.1 AMP-binding protein [Simiduia sp. 21SJ11W-1]
MIDTNSTVVEVLNKACETFAANPAFTCLGRTLTYAELDHLSLQFACYLQQHTGLKPGDRIAVQLPNILQYPVVVFGALRAGLTVVNTNPLYTPRELEHQLKDAGAKALVVLANIATSASEVVAKTSVEQVIVTEIGDLHGPVKRLLINSVLKYIKRQVPNVSFPNQVAFTHTLTAGDVARYEPSAHQPQDVAVLQYTGGTTGVAKGAMLTHANLVANMQQVREMLGEGINIGKELYVAPLPLYHIYAFTLHCMMLLAAGCQSVLIPNPRDIPGFVKMLKGKKITGFVGLNTLFNALCRDEEFAKLDFSALRTTASGGMALTQEAAKRWHEITGCVVSEGYGMTETSPVVTVNPPSAIQQGTVGLPVPETELKVVDEDGNSLPQGEPGELCVRGPQVMKGYWQRPEETAKVLDDAGWLKTGDMAVIQDDGYVRIVDRKKDMIIVSGFNVYPNEVEDVVCMHPAILEAAAVGLPDPKSGEQVKLFVVSSDAALTEQDVIDYCRKNMTAYKVPRSVEFRKELPKSNVGKILRRELKPAA